MGLVMLPFMPFYPVGAEIATRRPMSSKRIPLPGVLVTSDAATITFLSVLNESVRKADQFIVAALDAHNVFILALKLKFVQEKLADRLLDVTFDEDDLAEAHAGQVQS